MVQSKADRERQKLITDKCQSLIEVLLKDDDNKYCVDCDAKGPRWASWNLGVFLCIRCAGIHRNLGVHISKVKSVNLDAWTPEHVAYVQRMGNSRARAIYEANLPDDFRRPQTDTALESFIRAKYEHRKYIAQDYVDPGPPPPAFNIDDELKRMKEQKRSKITSSGTARMILVTDLQSNPKPRPTETLGLKNKVKATPGLVDLETVAATEAVNANAKPNKSALDLLIGVDTDSSSPSSAIDRSTTTTTNASLLTQGSNELTHDLVTFMDAPAPVSNNNNNIDLDFTSTPTQDTSSGIDNTKKTLTKESILSLYSASPSTNSASVGVLATNPATDPFGLNTTDDFFKSSSSGSGVSNQKFTKTGSSGVKNSSLDELFAGLDILHPKP